MVWLTAGLAAAYDATAIAAAKLRADARAGFPCLVRGSVTAALSRTEFYLQDESSGVRVVSEPFELHPGHRLEVEGWMYLAESGEFQLAARQIWLLADEPPPKPPLIPLADARAGGHQGRLVSVRGSVLSVDFGKEFDAISIQSGRSSLRIFSPANPRGLSAFERVYPGMEVAVAGISAPQTVAPEGDQYQLRLRSAADLAIREKPAAARSGFEWAGALAAVMFLCAAAVVWSGRRAPAASQVQYQPGGTDGAFRMEQYAQGGAEPDHRA